MGFCGMRGILKSFHQRILCGKSGTHPKQTAQDREKQKRTRRNHNRKQSGKKLQTERKTRIIQLMVLLFSFRNNKLPPMQRLSALYCCKRGVDFLSKW